MIREVTIVYAGPLRWALVTEIDFNEGRCKNLIRNFKLLWAE